MGVPALAVSNEGFGPSTECAAVSTDRQRVVVLLPCYNEERDLPPLFDRLAEIFSTSPYDLQIVVVDDGSTDGTVSIVQKAAEYLPLLLIQHPHNLGLGAALRTGLNALSDFEGVVVTMDADNSHDPALIPSMIQRISEGYDVVIASRFQRGGEMIGVQLHRRILSRIASCVSRMVFQYRNVRDYSSGYRAYRASTLRQLKSKYGTTLIRESGFACMLEVLLKLRVIRARASEVPLVLRYDQKLGSSKMRIFRTMTRYAVVMFGLLPSRSHRRRTLAVHTH